MAAAPLTARRVLSSWWPLASSWLLMSFELPAVSAVMARLSQPEVSLAAYGGLVFPLSMLIEAPIIMLLSASTALCKDWRSYLMVRTFMVRAGAGLTLLHVLIAFTPLFDVIARGIIHVPEPVVEPARLGLRIMTPWTWAIAYRRFQHGVLIRDGRSRVVGVGTLVRLFSNLGVLAVGFFAFPELPGIVVGATAVVTGVTTEAVFVGFKVRSSHVSLRAQPVLEEALTWPAFYKFYVPLAMTSLMTLLVPSMVAAGVSRMPRALDSLAVWPVISGINFIFRGVGFAFNEVVVSLLDEPGAFRVLRRTGLTLGLAGSAIFVLVLASPASYFWFEVLSALPQDLADLGRAATWLVCLQPLQAFLQSWFIGTLVHARETRGVSESVVVSLLVNAAVLSIGVALHSVTGVYVGLLGVALGAFAQVAWLYFRSRGPAERLQARATALVESSV